MDDGSGRKRQRTTTVSFSSFDQLPQEVLRNVVSFLPIEGVETFSQVSKKTRQSTEPARTRIQSLGITGRVVVGQRHFYTKDPTDSETRFYFPTTPFGTTEEFPHVTRRANPDLTPHLTDVASSHHSAMPNGLAPGNYPTRHRYDVDSGSGTLSAPILPTTSETRKTGTFAPVGSGSGLGSDFYVAPRYKAKVDAQQPVPGPGKPVRLTRAQSTPGGNPQHWQGLPVKFERK